MARRTPSSEQPAADETEESRADGADATGTGETDATGSSDPSGVPADAAAAARSPLEGEAGFFAWIRRLELTRRSGWLGGVCGGIGERIGIDPLLVRGIAVVLAVVGAPVALLYAIAWFLLPDEFGEIHAQQLGRGRVTRALPGIAAVFLLSFLPLTQGLWYAGALYWGDLGWGGAIGRIAWTGVLLIAVVVLVVVLARRASGEVRTTPATTDDRPDTVPDFPVEGAAPVGAGPAALVAAAGAASAPERISATADPVPEPAEPPAPGADASEEELAAWKRSQHEWQRQRAAWAAEQRRGERERRQAESHARAVAAAEAARERARVRRLTRPRASAGAVFLVLGVALVGGALAAFAAAQAPGTRGAEWTMGAGVLVLVLGAGTVVLALARRRSGALAFFAILSVLALAAAIVLPTDRAPAAFGVDTRIGGSYWQLTGTTSVYVQDWDAAGIVHTPDGPPVVDLWQLGGTVWIDVAEGATMRSSSRPTCRRPG